MNPHGPQGNCYEAAPLSLPQRGLMWHLSVLVLWWGTWRAFHTLPKRAPAEWRLCGPHRCLFTNMTFNPSFPFLNVPARSYGLPSLPQAGLW